MLIFYGVIVMDVAEDFRYRRSNWSAVVMPFEGQLSLPSVTATAQPSLFHGRCSQWLSEI